MQSMSFVHFGACSCEGTEQLPNENSGRREMSYFPIFIDMTDSKTLEMPFWLKLNMTIKEAAAYSNIGINRIEELLKQPKCNFVLYVGNKKLIKRKEFEQYISKSIEL